MDGEYVIVCSIVDEVTASRADKVLELLVLDGYLGGDKSGVAVEEGGGRIWSSEVDCHTASGLSSVLCHYQKGAAARLLLCCCSVKWQ